MRFFLTTLLVATLEAQPSAPAKPPVRVRPQAYPDRPPAPVAKVESGKAIYGVNCTFCHGADARGGSGGPNLIRNEVVLKDQDGELIAKVVREGREGMPKMNLTDTQVSDIAAFIHSFKVGGYDVSRMTPETIVVGKAEAGKSYFAATCAGCHSTTGDLKGIGGRIADPKVLQQTWIMPGSGRGAGARRVSPTTVTVTESNGKKTQGRLVRIDDFLVTVAVADGPARTFTRVGDVPRVELHDPLKPHKDLLAKYSDEDIHNLTAYLVTVK